MAQYKYVGDGMGVPGLPHEISDEAADALGVAELLVAAVENGSYVEVAISDPGESSRGDASAVESSSEPPAEPSFEDEKRTAKKRKE
jgi:hypothetical protein